MIPPRFGVRICIENPLPPCRITRVVEIRVRLPRRSCPSRSLRRSGRARRRSPSPPWSRSRCPRARSARRARTGTSSCCQIRRCHRMPAAATGGAAAAEGRASIRRSRARSGYRRRHRSHRVPRPGPAAVVVSRALRRRLLPPLRPGPRVSAVCRLASPLPEPLPGPLSSSPEPADVVRPDLPPWSSLGSGSRSARAPPEELPPARFALECPAGARSRRHRVVGDDADSRCGVADVMSGRRLSIDRHARRPPPRRPAPLPRPTFSATPRRRRRRRLPAPAAASTAGLPAAAAEQRLQQRQRDQHAGAVAQRPPRPVDRLAGTAVAQSQRGGDLLVAEAFELAHHDRRALRLGQRLQAAASARPAPRGAPAPPAGLRAAGDHLGQRLGRGGLSRRSLSAVLRTIR